jgi:putative DNA primase/helicase
MSYENIPDELKNEARWCVWKREQRNGKDTKVPYNPYTGFHARSNDISTFSDFETACGAFEKGGYTGLGIGMFNGFAAIDIDHCIENGEPSDVAKDIIEKMDSYTEISPSGKGIRIICKVNNFNYDTTKYKQNNHKIGLECYVAGSTNKYVTITGDHYKNCKVMDCAEQLQYVLERYMKKEPGTSLQKIQKALQSSNTQNISNAELIDACLKKDHRFNQYWHGKFQGSNESVNDFILIAKLLKCLNNDIEETIRYFKLSPYALNKDLNHKEKLERSDYLKRTINAVLAGKKSGDQLNPQTADLTQQGAAIRFSNTYADTLCHNGSWGWITWDGCKWIPNDTPAAKRAYMTLADTYKSEGQEAKIKAIESGLGGDYAETLSKFATGMRRDTFMTGCLNMASAWMQRDTTVFDNNAYDLNTPGGLINLKTGEIRPHDPKALCTKITKCTPADIKSNRWYDFIRWLTCGDEALARYLQYIAGMIAIGRVTQESLIVSWGAGANGKSTFFNVLQQILGDYAGSIAPEKLMAQNHQSQELTALASVFGKRLVIAAESEEGQRLSPSIVKRLASTDAIQAKMLYRDPFTFIPSHTLVFCTNHLPKVGSLDHGTWRRLIVVPFRATVNPGKEIKNLADELCKHEGGAIMQWIIEGARMFVENSGSLPESPAAVTEATEQYRASNNWLKNFISDRCENGQHSPVPSRALYEEYKIWAKDSGEYVRSASEFSNTLENEGYRKHKERNGIMWYGLRLKTYPYYTSSSRAD